MWPISALPEVATTRLQASRQPAARQGRVSGWDARPQASGTAVSEPRTHAEVVGLPVGAVLHPRVME